MGATISGTSVGIKPILVGSDASSPPHEFVGSLVACGPSADTAINQGWPVVLAKQQTTAAAWYRGLTVFGDAVVTLFDLHLSTDIKDCQATV